ncbi:hypothetical protein [Paenarthrobacter sp. PH39-S1]|uniref:hypothetical protein n=1 Tax=Paenarthrobacter sp. PH39-S1 TaxID=3046204 RepID=UPI0024BAF179|nr:hypothetical protein [Paenarthrobacter sp. PH39-S1]MDJ0355670.1 hypothetical protein [Paenarthrobacter sp. PH39-S1]
MDMNAIAAIVAAVGAIAAASAAFVALKPAQRAATAAEDQTEIQRDLMRQAAQPYVWADIQPDMQQGTMLHLVVGNAGPTTARNVRLVIDPPIPESPEYPGMTAAAQRRVSDGVLSLAPGRVIRWSLGRGFDLLADENSTTTYRLRVTADGPYGALQPDEFEIRPNDWREARDAPDGNLHFVRKEIEKLAQEAEKIRKHIQQENTEV